MQGKGQLNFPGKSGKHKKSDDQKGSSIAVSASIDAEDVSAASIPNSPSNISPSSRSSMFVSAKTKQRELDEFNMSNEIIALKEALQKKQDEVQLYESSNRVLKSKLSEMKNQFKELTAEAKTQKEHMTDVVSKSSSSEARVVEYYKVELATCTEKYNSSYSESIKLSKQLSTSTGLLKQKEEMLSHTKYALSEAIIQMKTQDAELHMLKVKEKAREKEADKKVSKPSKVSSVAPVPVKHAGSAATKSTFLPFCGTPFDTCGLFYYIGCMGFSKAYMNPHVLQEKGVGVGVVAAMSSTFPGCKSAPHKFVSHSPVGDAGFNLTLNIPNSWMSVDIGAHRRMQVHHYCLRHGGQVSSGAIRNWELQGSHTGNADLSGDWVVLSQHINDTSMPNEPNSVADWSVAKPSLSEAATPAAYRYFRIITTGKNAAKYDFLMCCGLELYGVLVVLTV